MCESVSVRRVLKLWFYLVHFRIIGNHWKSAEMVGTPVTKDRGGEKPNE